MADHDHSICNELLEQVSDYIDGELEPSLCLELESHLAGCPNCRIMVDTVRKTITLYRADAPSELPRDVEERLYEALKLDK
jgi:anti-sigma factor RsiW